MIKPFERLRIEFEGRLDVVGVSPIFGGMPLRSDGKSIETEAANSFAKAHYEQHTAVKGTIGVGDEVIDLDGLGLRDEYHKIRDCRIESEWDYDGYQTAMRYWAQTDEAEYEISGTVLSVIPLRNRRTSDDGTQLVTRMTAAMTSFQCNGMTGMGMSEYLDQIIDGQSVGNDFR